MKLKVRTLRGKNKGLCADTVKNTICGLWASYGNIDKHRDIIHKGAFAKTIQEAKNGFKYCVNHDLWRGVIGKSIYMEERDEGLYVEAKVSDTQLGKDILILARDGVLTQHSIGFYVVKEDKEDERDITHIREVRLIEGSILSVEPANDLAVVESLKHKYHTYFFSSPKREPQPHSFNKDKFLTPIIFKP